MIFLLPSRPNISYTQTQNNIVFIFSEIGDVTKQKDLSGFYRHLYKSTVHEDPKNNQNSEISRDSDSKTVLCSVDAEQNEDINQLQNIKQQRQYRKRTKSSSSKEEGEKTSSMSSSSENESGEDQKNQILNPNIIERNITTINEIKVSKFIEKENTKNATNSNESSKKMENLNLDICFTCDNEESKGETKKESVTDNTFLKPEIISNIWLKRTIGSNFDEAFQRYLERKSKRPCF